MLEESYDSDKSLTLPSIPLVRRMFYFTSESIHVNEAIKSKGREKLTVGVFMLQDNVPVYTAQVAVAKPANCAFEFLPISLTYQT